MSVLTTTGNGAAGSPQTSSGVHPAIQAASDYALKVLYPNRQYRAAVAILKRLIRTFPNSPDLWTNLGSTLWNLGEYTEAEAALLRALRLSPDHPAAHSNLALIYSSQRRRDDAEFAFNKTLECKPEKIVDVVWNRSMLRLTYGEYTRGFADYEARLGRRPDIYKTFPGPVWTGEDLTGKTIFVATEQGIGDTIMFARFLPELARRAGKVLFNTAPQITSLLWEYKDIVTFIPENVTMPVADYYTYLGSLPHRFGLTSPEEVPADPLLIMKHIEQRLKSDPLTLPEPPAEKPTPLKVGICWRGNPEMSRDHERSLPFEELLGLAEFPNCWLYSFQLGEGQRDIVKFGAEELVRDLSSDLIQRGLPGCGTALLQLDVFITSCTMLAHLAGALGVRTWLALSYDPYWVWGLERDHTPWYPSIKLFRQREPNQWNPVIADIKAALAEVGSLSSQPDSSSPMTN